MKRGYVLYADLECLLRPLPKSRGNKKTMKTKRHVPSGFSYALIKEGRELVTHRVYRGKNAMKFFLQDCLEMAANVMEIYDLNVPLRMISNDEEKFQFATKCHICDEAFEPGGDLKCRDHSHLTGKLIFA